MPDDPIQLVLWLLITPRQQHLQQAADAMDDAQRALQRGKGTKGLEEQRRAQRLLEMSQPESDPNDGGEGQPGDGKEFAREADVPPEQRDRAAEEFRKRVTEGLGRGAPPHLKDAIKRYTEGLLR